MRSKLTQPFSLELILGHNLTKATVESGKVGLEIIEPFGNIPQLLQQHVLRVWAILEQRIFIHTRSQAAGKYLDVCLLVIRIGGSIIQLLQGANLLTLLAKGLQVNVGDLSLGKRFGLCQYLRPKNPGRAEAGKYQRVSPVAVACIGC